MSWDKLSLREKAEYIKTGVRNGLKDIESIKEAYNKFAEGGPEDTIQIQRTYTPSPNIQEKISNWEGSSMKTNRSMEQEAQDFNRRLSPYLKERAPQEALDAMFSQSYNTGYNRWAEEVQPYIEGTRVVNEDNEFGRVFSIADDGSSWIRNDDGRIYRTESLELPEITVTGKKKSLGGNLFKDGGQQNPPIMLQQPQGYNLPSLIEIMNEADEKAKQAFNYKKQEKKKSKKAEEKKEGPKKSKNTNKKESNNNSINPTEPTFIFPTQEDYSLQNLQQTPAQQAISEWVSRPILSQEVRDKLDRMSVHDTLANNDYTRPFKEVADVVDPITQQERDSIVSELYKLVTGKPWKEIKKDSNFSYDGSLKGNLKIKDQLLSQLADQRLQDRFVKVDAEPENRTVDLFRKKSYAIDNEAGIDYTSPEKIPIKPFGTQSAMSKVPEYHDVDLYRQTAESSSYITECSKRLGTINRKALAKAGISVQLPREDAWKISRRAEEIGYKHFNAFEDFNIDKVNKSAVNRQVNKMLGNKEFQNNISRLQPGDYVEIMFPSSPNYDKAFKSVKKGQGYSYTTHVGQVIEDKNGKKFVVHNVHGDLRIEPFDKLVSASGSGGRSGVKISGGIFLNGNGSTFEGQNQAIQGDLSRFGRGYTENLLNSDRMASPVTYRTYDFIDKNYERLRKNGISNKAIEMFINMAPALSLKENINGNVRNNEGYTINTQYESNIKSATVGFATAANSDFAKLAYDKMPTKMKRGQSTGLYNVKLNNFDEKTLKKFGLDKLGYDQKEGVEVSTMLGLLYLDQTIKKLDKAFRANGIEEYNIDPKVYYGLAGTAWNQGTDVIEKSISKYAKNKDIDELKQYSGTGYGSGILNLMGYVTGQSIVSPEDEYITQAKELYNTRHPQVESGSDRRKREMKQYVSSIFSPSNEKKPSSHYASTFDTSTLSGLAQKARGIFSSLTSPNKKKSKKG